MPCTNGNARVQRLVGEARNLVFDRVSRAYPDNLTDREAGFIAQRDTLYMAIVNSDGWPYVQHRGGPPGFLRVLGPRQVAYADFQGNTQLVSMGNSRCRITAPASSASSTSTWSRSTAIAGLSQPYSSTCSSESVSPLVSTQLTLKRSPGLAPLKLKVKVGFLETAVLQFASSTV